MDDVAARTTERDLPERAAASEAPASRSLNVATMRILDVLAQFALVSAEFGVTELSQNLGMTKNMVHRALATLVAQGFLIRAASRRYELGYKVLELQNPNFPLPDIRSIAHPFLERLHEITGLTAQLSVRAGDGHVIIDGVEARGVLVTRTKLGQYFPLHASAASRAILATLSDEEIAAYIERNAPLQRFTENTLVARDEIMGEVAKIRERGYSESLEDFNKGGFSLAFAIIAADGSPHAAVTVGGPPSQFSRARAGDLLPAIQGVVEELRRVARLYDPS